MFYYIETETDSQIGRLADWQIGRSADADWQQTGRSADWQTGRLADWQICSAAQLHSTLLVGGGTTFVNPTPTLVVHNENVPSSISSELVNALLPRLAPAFAEMGGLIRLGGQDGIAATMRRRAEPITSRMQGLDRVIGSMPLLFKEFGVEAGTDDAMALEACEEMLPISARLKTTTSPSGSSSLSPSSAGCCCWPAAARHSAIGGGGDVRLASRRRRRRGTRRSSVKLRGLGRVHPHDRDPGIPLSCSPSRRRCRPR